MSFEILGNAIRQQARAAWSDKAQPQICVITSYDGAGNVKVNVSPDPSKPVESNWMPLGCIGVGNGWGVLVGPQIGDQVLCVFENGDFEGGVIVARLFSTQQQAIPVPSGEVWAVHKSGSFLKFVNSGDVELNSAANLTATVGGNATVTASGQATLQAGGTATVKATSIILQNAGGALKALLNSAFSAWAASHVHSNGNGGANTGAPIDAPPAAGQTSVVQAE